MQSTLAHEAPQAIRMLDFREQRAAHPLLIGALNMLQTTLA